MVTTVTPFGVLKLQIHSGHVGNKETQNSIVGILETSRNKETQRTRHLKLKSAVALYQQLQVLTYPWLRRLRRARAKKAEVNLQKEPSWSVFSVEAKGVI